MFDYNYFFIIIIPIQSVLFASKGVVIFICVILSLFYSHFCWFIECGMVEFSFAFLSIMERLKSLKWIEINKLKIGKPIQDRNKILFGLSWLGKNAWPFRFSFALFLKQSIMNKHYFVMKFLDIFECQTDTFLYL